MVTIVRTLYRVISLMLDYYWGVRVKGWTLVGADTLLQWEEDSNMARYMSFSEDPYNAGDEDAMFDEFGVEDSAIFYYLDGFWEMIRFMLAESHDGWLITQAWLVYIKD